MSLTNFPNGVSSFGVPLGSVLTYGTYYFVDADNGSDSYDGLSMDTAFATIDKALDTVTTNKDDVIVLSTNGSHQLTEMLTVSKSRVHFVGDQFGRLYGQRAKINYADGIATADPFAVKVTGVGNTFTGIKFLNNNTDAALEEDIQSIISEYFPSVIVENLTVVGNPDTNQITVTLKYSIKDTGVTDNLEISFN